jgi:DNA-binding NtrC family response regulator
MQKGSQQKILSIWIVDDDRCFCQQLKMFLEDNKLNNVLTFYTCESALRNISQSLKCPEIICWILIFRQVRCQVLNL